MQPHQRKGFAAVAVVALVGMVAFTGFANASHRPADKLAVAGSTVEFLHASSGGGAADGLLDAGLTDALGEPTSEVVSLLSGTLRTSSPTDLLVRVSAECALWTNVTTVGDDDQEAVATVTLWVELDGAPIGVSSDDTGADAGRVVFCNRAYHVVTTDWDDENASLAQYLRTRSANAFEWMTLNVGNGVHTLVVKAELATQVSEAGEAAAAVGKRTLVVEPVKLANDASL